MALSLTKVIPLDQLQKKALFSYLIFVSTMSEAIISPNRSCQRCHTRESCHQKSFRHIPLVADWPDFREPVERRSHAILQEILAFICLKMRWSTYDQLVQ